KQAALNDELGSAVVAGQDAVLVADKLRVAHCQLPVFETDAGAVPIGNASAFKIEALDEEVAVLDHPNPLAGSGLAIGNDPRASADRTNRQALLRPYGDVTAVFPGLHFHGIAVVRELCCLRDRPHVTGRSNAYRRRIPLLLRDLRHSIRSGCAQT